MQVHLCTINISRSIVRLSLFSFFITFATDHSLYGNETWNPNFALLCVHPHLRTDMFIKGICWVSSVTQRKYFLTMLNLMNTHLSIQKCSPNNSWLRVFLWLLDSDLIIRHYYRGKFSVTKRSSKKFCILMLKENLCQKSVKFL